MIGKTLNGYRILDKIKEGSVGTVWRAARSDNKPVAIKQISEKNARNSRKLRQFRREATLTRKLKHGNIIRVTFEAVDGFFSDFDFAPDVGAKTEGRFRFYVYTYLRQSVRLRATLYDRDGNASEPYDFTFDAR